MVDGYSEATEHPRIASVPLSHLSIEVGHFTLKTIAEDPDALRREFRRIVPLVAAFSESARVQYGPDARISTCYLVDDYFQADDAPDPSAGHDVGPNPDAAEPDPAKSPARSPSKILPRLLDAARDCGLVIDYLARESACARTTVFADGVPLGEPIPLAEMVAARIVPEPSPADTGGRPPTAESGWLCNGRRSSLAEPTQAMRERTYRPPNVYSANEHTIFIDIELWKNDGDGRTRWSCPFLAAIWHLLRLGMLRFHGAAVVNPQPQPDAPWPARWQDLPPVVRLNPEARPFAAYQTLSMLPKRYIEIEHAVGVILGHLDLDEDVLAQIVAAGRAEGVAVPSKVSERQGHLLLDGS